MTLVPTVIEEQGITCDFRLHRSDRFAPLTLQTKISVCERTGRRSEVYFTWRAARLDDHVTAAFHSKRAA